MEKHGLFQRFADFLFGYDFFISYCWDDGRHYAVELQRQLEAQGFNCFLDSSDYAKSDNWRAAGRRALKKTSRLILVGTPKAVESEPVENELRIFSGLKRRVFPIDIGGALAGNGNQEGVFRYLDPEVLRVGESEAALTAGPSENVVQEIRDSFNLLRQGQKRIRWFAGLTGLFAVVAAVAVGAGWFAVEQKKVAEARMREAQMRLLQNHLQQATTARDYLKDHIASGHHFLRAAQIAEELGRSRLKKFSLIGLSRLALPSASFPHDGPISGVASIGDRFLTWGDTVKLWRKAEDCAVFIEQIPMDVSSCVPTAEGFLAWGGNDVWLICPDKGAMKEYCAHDEAVWSAGILNGRVISWSGTEERGVDRQGKVLFWPQIKSNGFTEDPWWLSEWLRLGQPTEFGDMISGTKFFEDGVLMWGDGKVGVWSTDGGYKGSFEHEGVTDADMCADRVVTWSEGNAKLWVTPNKEPVSASDENLTGAKFIVLDGIEYFFTWGYDGKLKLWEGGDEPQSEWEQHSAPVGGMQLSSDQLFSWGLDGTVREFPSGAIYRHGGPVWNAARLDDVVVAYGANEMPYPLNEHHGFDLGGSAKLFVKESGTDSEVEALAVMGHGIFSHFAKIQGEHVFTWADSFRSVARQWQAKVANVKNVDLDRILELKNKDVEREVDCEDRGSFKFEIGDHQVIWKHTRGDKTLDQGEGVWGAERIGDDAFITSIDGTVKQWSYRSDKVSAVFETGEMLSSIVDLVGEWGLLTQDSTSVKLWAKGAPEAFVSFDPPGKYIGEIVVGRDDIAVEGRQGAWWLWSLEVDELTPVEARIREYEIQTATTMDEAGDIRDLGFSEWAQRVKRLDGEE